MIMEILTAFLLIVTAVYVFMTYKMSVMSERSVQIMKEQTEAMSRPYVVVQPLVRPNTSLMYLKIYNSGKTPALKVKLELDRDFFQFGESNKNLKEFGIFSSRLDRFAPNQELFFGLGQGWDIFGDSKKSLPKQFVVTATYSYMDKVVVEKSHIDLCPFEQSEGEANPIVEELKIIREALEK